MGKITDFLRKIGVLRVSSGDYQTGEFDNKEDLKKEKNNDQQEEKDDDNSKCKYC